MTLAEALQEASVDEILEALGQVERNGLLYDLGLAIFACNPSKTFPGASPYSIYDDPNHGTLYVNGFDPERRRDAILGAREIQGLSTMEALAFAKSLSETTPYEEYLCSPEDAQENKERWESYGYTVEVCGFGESRTKETHVISLQRAVGPWPA